MSLALSAVGFLATLTLILWRPRGMNEAVAAGIGAAFALAARLVSLRDVARIFHDTANVLLFLIGMMVITGFAEHAGVFDALAVTAARTARGSGRLLLVNVFLLGALITAFLSLDVTIIVLTPIVYVVVDRLAIDPLPYLFACAFVANTASLFLPVSNLTNILMYDLLGLSFTRFALLMFLPNVAALLVNVGVFLVIFRARIPRRFDAAGLTDADHGSDFHLASVALVMTLVALFIFGFLSLPLAIPALVGAGVVGVVGLVRRTVSVRATVGYVSWSLFPFVIAMFIVIRGVERAWLPHVSHIPTGKDFLTLAAVTFATAVGANVVNNIPMVVAMIALLRSVTNPIPEHIAFATLIGTNIGPSVLTIGSLATMLWLAIVRKRGVTVSSLNYLRVGIITTPPMLAAATFALWVMVRLVGK